MVCLRRMSVDRGVENATVADIQGFLRRNKHIKTAHFYLKNVLQISKLREVWWSHLRKVFLQRRINYFKDLIDEGLFDPSNEVDQECLRFSFYGIFQDGLDKVMKA